MCDYCGVQWHASDMVKDRSGRWRCPDEGEGMDRVAAAEDDMAAVVGRVDRRGGYPASNVKGTTDLDDQGPFI